MPCYHPIKAYRSRSGRNQENQKWPVVFKRQEGYSDKELQLPCGRCVGCRLDRSRVWAIRCMHEYQIMQEQCRPSVFLTLTYSDDNIPAGGSLEPQDMVRFLKRLRKHFVPINPYSKLKERENWNKFNEQTRIRFYQCGEYGERTNRPHHHAIIFGLDFDDKKFHSNNRGNVLYKSEILEKLWPHGYSLIGSVTFDSCAYVARYIMKKSLGKDAWKSYTDIDVTTGEVINERVPEYTTMSRNPGIGKTWYDKYKSDVYNKAVGGYIVNKGGDKIKPPQYYENLFERESPDVYREVVDKQGRQLRKQFVSLGQRSLMLVSRRKEAEKNKDDNTLERLRVKEKVKVAALSQLKRELE